MNRVDLRSVMSSADQPDSEQILLSWYVPVDDRTVSRTQVLRLVFAGMICLGVVLVLGSRPLRLAGLLGAIPFGLFVASRVKAVRRKRMESSDNVRLDDKGFCWCDDHGDERRIARDQIESFRIGVDPDTIRALPALTLILAGGFESQPVELHAPVGPSHVRQFLVDRMKIDESKRDDVFAVRLHDALAVSCEQDGQRPEMRVLRLGLIAPEKLPDGTWRVARLADGQEVVYLPSTCRFQFRSGERSVETADVAGLAESIHVEVLAKREVGLQAWLATLEQQNNQRAELELRRDARRLGYYVEFDAQGRLHLEGSRTGLLRLCDRIVEAAEQLRIAPFGARPDSVNVGGTSVRLAMVLDEVPWCGHETIAGPRSYLRAVGEQLRERVRAEPDDDFLVQVVHASFEPQRFCIHRRGEPYDPLAQCQLP